jgi:hypothetical protein
LINHGTIMSSTATTEEHTISAVYLSSHIVHSTSTPTTALLQAYEAAAAPAYQLIYPQKWPKAGKEPQKTLCYAAHNELGLHLLYNIYGDFKCSNSKGKADKLSILKDSRVECFIGPAPSGSLLKVDNNSWYNGYEVNARTHCLDFRRTGADFDYGWAGSSTAAILGNKLETQNLVRITIPWGDLHLNNENYKTAELRIGIFRGDTHANGEFTWTSVVEPGTEEINFHVPQCFAHLKFQ